MAILGYARVSTQGQDLTAQIEALKTAGAETTFKEKVSGVRADRPQLAKLMASLQAGDIVVVTKLDRLGRSTRELLDLIERIGKAGAAFRSRSAIRSRPSSPPLPTEIVASRPRSSKVVQKAGGWRACDRQQGGPAANAAQHCATNARVSTKGQI